MKVLLDTGVWWRRTFGLPIQPALRRFLEQAVTEWWLSPLSVAEMTYKITHKGLPAPKDPGWLVLALQGYNLAPISFEAGRVAGSWPWKHGDPVDRCLAAVALVEGLTLVHTDTKLKRFSGFPQRYFPGSAVGAAVPE